MDADHGSQHTRYMTVMPLAVPVPERGGIIVARDVTGRVLRITGHPESGRVVLSIWQGAVCVATVRLAPEDVSEVSAALVRAAVPAPGWVEPPARPDRDGEPATVTRLPVRPPTSIGDDATALARRGWKELRRRLGLEPRA